MRTIAAALLLAAWVEAAEPKVHRDIPYAEPNNERQTLDVYAPAEGDDHPIVVWIHGGGWRRGDKANVHDKPQAFTQRGFVFVSTNYRFVPNVTIKEMTRDIARAIRWVHDHAREYGGDPQSVYVMGHSAGAHLAALVCTDERYLKEQGLSLSILRGCVPVDVAVYDIPLRLKDSSPAAAASYRETFGSTEESQREYSPVTHLARGKGIPPFLILHVADRAEAKTQSEWFAQKLREAAIPAQVVAASGKTHATINSELGRPDDPPTRALFEFLDRTLKQRASDTP
jgi:acetyl esterase/lipase